MFEGDTHLDDIGYRQSHHDCSGSVSGPHTSKIGLYALSMSFLVFDHGPHYQKHSRKRASEHTSQVEHSDSRQRSVIFVSRRRCRELHYKQTAGE